MHRSLSEQARAGRRAALSALNARLGTKDRVVSIFEGSFPRRRAIPEFHSVRGASNGQEVPVRAHLIQGGKAAA